MSVPSMHLLYFAYYPCNMTCKIIERSSNHHVFFRALPPHLLPQQSSHFNDNATNSDFPEESFMIHQYLHHFLFSKVGMKCEKFSPFWWDNLITISTSCMRHVEQNIKVTNGYIGIMAAIDKSTRL
ncbi:hypothetical protein OCU04_007748 [Sclerotinia nivalis]|uniref:Uncharacterized protein n=1 Tax=Sclerotinia nivalis TaxID=352851 RepID=A0A9X0AJF4_9HELO|nr:hypothetical protein OCU04_007748 [Sclerotinia nivalis]